MDEPLMLLPILDVERGLERRGLARRDENALRLLDHVLDPTVPSTSVNSSKYERHA
jgi:hypothetical protein